MSPKFQFGNVVVVNRDEIGVIVKTWGPSLTKPNDEYTYEVYVRLHNCVSDFKESDIQHYIYSKELTNEELEYYG